MAASQVPENGSRNRWLLAEGKITEDVVANMRSWKHSGFSIDQSVRLEVGD